MERVLKCRKTVETSGCTPVKEAPPRGWLDLHHSSVRSFGHLVKRKSRSIFQRAAMHYQSWLQLRLLQMGAWWSRPGGAVRMQDAKMCAGVEDDLILLTIEFGLASSVYATGCDNPFGCILPLELENRNCRLLTSNGRILSERS